MKEKPTVEQFISMNRGINNGGDLPRELLEVSVSIGNKIRIDSLIIELSVGNTRNGNDCTIIRGSGRVVVFGILIGN